MMQNVLKNLQELHGQIEQLPVDQQTILTSNVEQLSASLQALNTQFQSLLLSKESLTKLDRINRALDVVITEKNTTIRYLEQQLDQSQMLYKRVAQALTKGEARLQTLLRNSSDLMTILEADGRIRDQNAIAVKRMLGYNLEQRIGIGNNLLHDSSINGIVINSRDITERKLSAAALEKSQQQIVNILEKITDGFFTLNCNYEFTYVNPKAEQWLQRRRQELIGKNIWGEFPETIDTIFFEQFYRSVSDKTHVKFEASYPPLNVWFEVETYPSEEGLSVFFQNITDRKNAEDALRRSESRYRILSQITSDFGYSFKVLPDNTWFCEWMTEAFTNITGYTAKEIVTSGGLQFDCIHPDDVEMLLEQMQFRSSSCKEVSEYRIITKSGEIRWMWDCRQVVWDEVENRAVGIYGACQDITEHKLVQAKVCETNQVLQGLIKALPLAVFGVDTNSLVTVWNSAAGRLFGWKESEILGELLPIVPNDHNADYSAILDVELVGETQVTRECRRRKDGSSIHVFIWTTPMRDADGLIAGSMSIVSPILPVNEMPENIEPLSSHKNKSEPFWARYVKLPLGIQNLETT